MSVQLNSKLESVSNFPILPEIRHEESYTQIFEAAISKYRECYEKYSKKCSELDNLITIWDNEANTLKSSNAPAEIADAFVNSRIDQYIPYREIRNELLAMRNDFDNAIPRLEPPALDPATLIVMEKLNLNTKEFQEKYDESFIRNRNDLIEAREKVNNLYESIVPKLESLKQPLENIKYKYSNCNQFTYRILQAYCQSQTPLVKQLVDEKEKQLAQFKSAITLSDEKKSSIDPKKKEKTAAKPYHNNPNKKEASFNSAGTDQTTKKA